MDLAGEDKRSGKSAPNQCRQRSRRAETSTSSVCETTHKVRTRGCHLPEHAVQRRQVATNAGTTCSFLSFTKCESTRTKYQKETRHGTHTATPQTHSINGLPGGRKERGIVGILRPPQTESWFRWDATFNDDIEKNATRFFSSPSRPSRPTTRFPELGLLDNDTLLPTTNHVHHHVPLLNFGTFNVLRSVPPKLVNRSPSGS